MLPRFLIVALVVILIIVSIVVTSARGATDDVRRNSPIVTTMTPIITPITTPINDYTAPVRRVSKGEAECRRVLERIYGVPFPSVWPSWLKSPETNRKLEIDCYAEIPYHVLGIDRPGSASIGCEYQGRQHYYYTPSMQNDMTAYDAQLWNDEFKRRMCEVHGVHLIEVPYTIHIANIREFIYTTLKGRNLLPQSGM